MIQVIAIDDEPFALSAIKELAAKVDFIHLNGIFTSANTALSFLKNNKVDAVFLDINMPDVNGIELAGILKHEPQIVFTTAYSEYAATGFDLNATDYLLKPVSLVRFMQCCYKIAEKKNHQTISTDIYLKGNREWFKLNTDEILFIAASGNYINITCIHEKITIRSTLPELLEKLPSTFIRVHKSYIINRNCINRIEAHEISIGLHKIPVGSTYRQDIFNRLGLKEGTI